MQTTDETAIPEVPPPLILPPQAEEEQQQPPPPPLPDVKPGDVVLIRATVIAVDGYSVTILCDSVDLPGSKGYQQRVTLHHAGPIERA